VVKVRYTRQSPPMRGRSCGPCGQSPLYETKSSDEGQIIEAPRGRSPLYETKSSDEGQICGHCGQQSVVRDKVLHRGATLGRPPGQ
jgi:hypothetical protein